jgi:hypothetical protein
VSIAPMRKCTHEGKKEAPGHGRFLQGMVNYLATTPCSL